MRHVLPAGSVSFSTAIQHASFADDLAACCCNLRCLCRSSGIRCYVPGPSCALKGVHRVSDNPKGSQSNNTYGQTLRAIYTFSVRQPAVRLDHADSMLLPANHHRTIWDIPQLLLTLHCADCRGLLVVSCTSPSCCILLHMSWNFVALWVLQLVNASPERAHNFMM